MASLYGSFVDSLNLAINNVKKMIEHDDEENLQALYAKMISSFDFMMGVLIGKEKSYSNMIKFQNTMASLESLFMTYPMSDYEKGQLIRKFLVINFEQSTNNTISLIYDKAILDFSSKMNMPVPKAEFCLEKYFKNPDSEEIPSEIKCQIKAFLETIEKENIDFGQKYNTFKRKYLNIDDNFEIGGLKESLSELGVPTNIVNYYYVYCKEIYDKKQKNKKTFIVKEEKKEIKKEKTYSKKELKNELLKYCDLKSDKPFDYHNYKQVLELLKKLQFADNINERYFNYCNINRVENNAYYNVLFNKIKDKKKYLDIVDMVYFIREKMFICSEEEYDAYLKEIFQVLDMVDDCEMLNFDYEIQMMKRVRQKHE